MRRLLLQPLKYFGKRDGDAAKWPANLATLEQALAILKEINFPGHDAIDTEVRARIAEIQASL
ncbi:MAG: hypothetical protein R3E66_20030 [bacterium]